MSTTSRFPQQNSLLFWALVFAAFCAFLWMAGGVLTPFVLGAAVGYLLDPAVDALEKRKIPRGLGSACILAIFFAIIIFILLLIAPPLAREGGQLAESAPAMLDRLWNLIAPYLQAVQERLGGGDPETIKKMLLGNAGTALAAGGGILAGLGNGGLAVAGFLGTLVVTPLVAFFMMKEWDNMKRWVDNLIPRSSRHTIHGLMKQIDRKLAGFVRGQITVAFVLALFYGIALMLCGLNFGFIIGLGAGLLYIIPYVGTAFGLIAGLSAALFQGFTWILAAKVIGVFVAGQVFETYFLTPKLVGESVGLHPLWILFSVMLGGALFGVIGMLLAVPVAAVASVLIGFVLTRYKNSNYYKDNGA